MFAVCADLKEGHACFVLDRITCGIATLSREKTMLPEMDWLTLGCCRGVGFAVDLFEVFVGLVNDVVAGCYFGVDLDGDVVCEPEIPVFAEIQKSP